MPNRYEVNNIPVLCVMKNPEIIPSGCRVQSYPDECIEGCSWLRPQMCVLVDEHGEYVNDCENPNLVPGKFGNVDLWFDLYAATIPVEEVPPLDKKVADVTKWEPFVVRGFPMITPAGCFVYKAWKNGYYQGLIAEVNGTFLCINNS